MVMSEITKTVEASMKAIRSTILHTERVSLLSLLVDIDDYEFTTVSEVKGLIHNRLEELEAKMNKGDNDE